MDCPFLVETGSFLFASRPLDRRVVLIGVRAVHAAVTGFGLEDCAAAGALVEIDSKVFRHLFAFGEAACRAGEVGKSFDHWRVLQGGLYLSWRGRSFEKTQSEYPVW